MDINELIVSSYLEHVLACDMVETHVFIGERIDCIDVVGVNTRDWTVYVCEVENHLMRPKTSIAQQKLNHVARYVTKFRHIVPYVNNRYEGFTKQYMLWTPVVNEAKASFILSPVNDAREIVTLIKIECGIDVEVIANEQFAVRLKQLRNVLGQSDKILRSPVLRFIQMEEKLKLALQDHPRNYSAVTELELPSTNEQPGLVAIRQENE